MAMVCLSPRRTWFCDSPATRTWDFYQKKSQQIFPLPFSSSPRMPHPGTQDAMHVWGHVSLTTSPLGQFVVQPFLGLGNFEQHWSGLHFVTETFLLMYFSNVLFMIRLKLFNIYFLRRNNSVCWLGFHYCDQIRCLAETTWRSCLYLLIFSENLKIQRSSVGQLSS